MSHRYPGPSSFDDNIASELTFFGRTKEINELADRIISEHLTVLYGKSGIGKTSLLNAGLFPRMRELGFAPFIVRLKTASGRWIETIIDAFEKMVHKKGFQLTSPDEGTFDNIGDYFAAVVLTDGDQFLKPVIVLDQFEEVFQMSFDDLAQLNQKIFKVLGRSNVYRKQDSMRVVFSLREEYVGALDEFSNNIPSLLHNRLRLKPLDLNGTKEAIVAPAGLQSDLFETPEFEYDDDLIDKILDYLSIKGEFEPIQLQIICAHVEKLVQAKVSNGIPFSPVTLSGYFEGEGKQFQKVLEQFYLNTLEQLGNEISRNKVRDLCEYGLVQNNGLRNSIATETIKKEYDVDDETLKLLVNTRLLRCEDRLNDMWYEISHDRIAEAVLSKRRFKLPKLFWGILIAMVFLLIAISYSLLKERQQSTLLEAATNNANNRLAKIEQINADLENTNREIKNLRNRLANAVNNVSANVSHDAIPIMVEVPSEEQFKRAPDQKMGADASGSKNFRISKFEITEAQYYKFIQAKNLNWPNSDNMRSSQKPVINVTWQDARNYANWLTDYIRLTDPLAPAFRLPTENEWKLAAKAGSYGVDLSNAEEACMYMNHADRVMNVSWSNKACSDGVGNETSVVGTFLPNRYGLHDMLGNAAEWTADCWLKEHDDNIDLTQCRRRLVKGGSWQDKLSDISEDKRAWAFGDSSYDYIGFRLVQNP